MRKPKKGLWPLRHKGSDMATAKACGTTEEAEILYLNPVERAQQTP